MHILMLKSAVLRIFPNYVQNDNYLCAENNLEKTH